MGPAQMTNTIAEGQTAFVPTWVSAFSTDPESNELLPAQWGMMGQKLQEATVLGDIIKNNEFSAKVGDGSFIEDVTHRELLIKACKQAQESMRQMTQQSQEEKFEQLCKNVVHLQNTPKHETDTTNGSRLIVPTGKQPLSFFEWSYWTKFDPVRPFT